MRGQKFRFFFQLNVSNPHLIRISSQIEKKLASKVISYFGNSVLSIRKSLKKTFAINEIML